MKFNQNKIMNEEGYFVDYMAENKDSGALTIKYSHEVLPITIGFLRKDIFSSIQIEVEYRDGDEHTDGVTKHKFNLRVIQGINQIINELKFSEDSPDSYI